MRISNTFFGQEYVKERLKLSFMKFHGRYEDLIKQYEAPLPNVTGHSGGRPYELTHSIDQALHQFVILFLNLTLLFLNLNFYPIVWGFHRTFATGVSCQQKTLTPPGTLSCPTCICSNVETGPSWTCLVSGHPLVHSILFDNIDGAAVAEWLKSWFAEQEDLGSIPGLDTWIFRDWLSPASKSRYGWYTAEAT